MAGDDARKGGASGRKGGASGRKEGASGRKSGASTKEATSGPYTNTSRWFLVGPSWRVVLRKSYAHTPVIISQVKNIITSRGCCCLQAECMGWFASYCCQ